MKLKIFLVTYNKEDLLKQNLESLLDSDVHLYDFGITIINNYTESFELQGFCKKNNISVIHNNARPSFSTGHLSRSWNQCLIQAFKSLKNPDCDIAVLAQDDNLFLSSWASYIVERHQTYDFISMGGGDQYHSYKPDHVKKVGLWDERFCNIGYQEYDYFIRSYLYNREKISINDPKHARVFCPIQNKIINESDNLIGGMRNDPRHLDSIKYHSISRNILRLKWGNTIDNLNKQTGWVEELKYLSTINESKIPNFIYYPYFEKDIDLTNKNYIL